MSRENVERWHDLLSHFPDFATDVLEVRDLGALTLSTARFHGSGGASEAPFEQVVWQVAEWREGRIAWWRSFRTEAGGADRCGGAVGLSTRARAI